MERKEIEVAVGAWYRRFHGVVMVTCIAVAVASAFCAWMQGGPVDWAQILSSAWGVPSLNCAEAKISLIAVVFVLAACAACSVVEQLRRRSELAPPRMPWDSCAPCLQVAVLLGVFVVAGPALELSGIRGQRGTCCGVEFPMTFAMSGTLAFGVFVLLAMALMRLRLREFKLEQGRRLAEGMAEARELRRVLDLAEEAKATLRAPVLPEVDGWTRLDGHFPDEATGFRPEPAGRRFPMPPPDEPRVTEPVGILDIFKGLGTKEERMNSRELTTKVCPRSGVMLYFIGGSGASEQEWEEEHGRQSLALAQHHERERSPSMSDVPPWRKRGDGLQDRPRDVDGDPVEVRNLSYDVDGEPVGELKRAAVVSEQCRLGQLGHERAYPRDVDAPEPSNTPPSMQEDLEREISDIHDNLDAHGVPRMLYCEGSTPMHRKATLWERIGAYALFKVDSRGSPGCRPVAKPQSKPSTRGRIVTAKDLVRGLAQIVGAISEGIEQITGLLDSFRDELTVSMTDRIHGPRLEQMVREAVDHWYGGASRSAWEQDRLIEMTMKFMRPFDKSVDAVGRSGALDDLHKWLDHKGVPRVLESIGPDHACTLLQRIEIAVNRPCTEKCGCSEFYQLSKLKDFMEKRGFPPEQACGVGGDAISTTMIRSIEKLERELRVEAQKNQGYWAQLAEFVQERTRGGAYVSSH